MLTASNQKVGVP